MTNTFKVDYSERLVAFIDILGFKRMVESEKDKAIKIIESLRRDIGEVLSIIKEGDYTDYSIKLFSDCMCISCPDKLENIYYIIYQLMHLQFFLAVNGIFLRGGLSHGLHFENDIMIFSKGLINAYELEKKAIYPRIIVDHVIVDIIHNDMPENLKESTLPFLRKSPDSLVFIDYLQAIEDIAVDDDDFFQEHKKAILQQINTNMNDSTVLDKYRWLSEYHNTMVMENYDPDDYEKEIYINTIKENSIEIKATFPSFEKL